MNYLASVVQVLPGDNFTVYAYFSDGTVKLADAKPLIAKGGVFAQLADPDFFRERLTVMDGAVVCSSTHIRALLDAGETARARALMEIREH